MVVRETDGTLRMANREEHRRMIQLWYPQNGRLHNTPRIFRKDNMQVNFCQHSLSEIQYKITQGFGYIVTVLYLFNKCVSVGVA